MELRSTRSRSKSPFDRRSIEKEILNAGNHIGKTYVRTTRSSIIKTASSGIDNITDINTSDSHLLKPSKTRNSKSDRVVRKTRYKTSDYSSSEDSEKLSPSHSVNNQNVNNEFIEEIRRSVSRSSGVSALDVYRAAGDYWNKFPKTDYTYSAHSRDRTEIAPGIIAMPNMSRRSLHNYNMTTDKQTNTELFEDDEIDYTLNSSYTSKFASDYNTENLKNIRTRSLFSNNNYRDKYVYETSRASSIRYYFERTVSIITTTIMTIISWLLMPAYYVYNTQNSGLIWMGKIIHRTTTKLMIWDAWLLRSDRRKRKLTTVLALCFIPLLLLGGWWLLSGLGPILYGTLANSTSTILSSLPTFTNLEHKTDIDLSHDHNYQPDNIIQVGPIKSTDTRVEEKIITVKERIILEPPKADEIAAELTSNQLEEIADSIKRKLNIENYHAKHTESSSRETIDGDIFKNQQIIIEQLKEEINKVRAKLINLEQARNDDITNLINQHNSRLTYQLNRCCRSSVAHMESYITRLLKDLLGAPHYLSTQSDISNWLHSTFVAKEDLEFRLTNLTQHLKSDYDTLIENNGKLLMDKIMSSITTELNARIEKALTNIQIRDVKEINLNTLTDEHIKKIVRDTLEIYDADKTGLVDYALESAGGQILSTRCTESYQARTAVLSILGIPLWYPTNTPRTVISPGMTPGECWAFQNFPGFLLVKLAAPIKIEAFSLEHISKMLVSNARIDSAPKDFSVYGLRNESDKEPMLIGQYTYKFDGPSLQYFAAAVHGLIFDIIELRILSNHGNPNYTCLYRFRVHGTLNNSEPT